MERQQFTFYSSFARAIQRIKDAEVRAMAYDVVVNYALRGDTPGNLISGLKEPKHQAELKAFFELIKPALDKERRQGIEGRKCLEYKIWRRKVFERDNFTCQLCGAYGVRLNAHHIKPYAFFPGLRYDLNNGITLCEHCHREVHKRTRNHAE